MGKSAIIFAMCLSTSPDGKLHPNPTHSTAQHKTHTHSYICKWGQRVQQHSFIHAHGLKLNRPHGVACTAAIIFYIMNHGSVVFEIKLLAYSTDSSFGTCML